MPEFEDVVVQLFLAGLYFGGVFVTASVILSPESAFQYALVGLIVAMLGYLVIRTLGYHKPGPIMGIYISFGFAILTFGLIWWVIRVVLESIGSWPFSSGVDR